MHRHPTDELKLGVDHAIQEVSLAHHGAATPREAVSSCYHLHRLR
jgi:hypothetical protein